MSERLKEHAWKACIRLTTYRGFVSLSLRRTYSSEYWSLRDEKPRTPPGPEGSNGSGRHGRRSQAGARYYRFAQVTIP